MKMALTVLALGALAGCATVSESHQQDVTVHTILDNREIGGAGCVLSNDAGRWFVMAPGRVTVTKSAGLLSVDCKKDAQVAGKERFASRANNTATIGNAITTAGLGYLLDKRTGAGFDYPETLTVLMKSSATPAREPGQPEAPPRSVVY